MGDLLVFTGVHSALEAFDYALYESTIDIGVATLPCKTSVSENKRHSQTNVVIYDKSQGGVATHLRCGEIFNSHIFTNILQSLPVKKSF